MRSTHRCNLFLPGGAAGIPATVTVSTTGLKAKADKDGEPVRVELSYHLLHAARGGYNNKMLVLSSETPEGKISLYFEDDSFVNALGGIRLPPGLLSDLTRLTGSGAKLEKFVLLAGAVAALAALVWFLLTWGLSAAAGLAVDQVPQEWETELGRMGAEEILGQNMVCSARGVNDAVQTMGRRLVEAAAVPDRKFTFVVVDSPDVNAFALPGGYVFVNYGLIEKAETPEEVAGVLAHEIQHVLKRHGLKNVVGRAGLGLILGLMLGDLEGLGGLIIGASSELAALSFSREQEEEADALGLDLLYAANIDPSGLPAFFEKLASEQESKGTALPSFLSTHPDTTERIRALTAETEGRGKGAGRKFAFSWEAAKAGCSPVSQPDPDEPVAATGELSAEGL